MWRESAHEIFSKLDYFPDLYEMWQKYLTQFSDPNSGHSTFYFSLLYIIPSLRLHCVYLHRNRRLWGAIYWLFYFLSWSFWFVLSYIKLQWNLNTGGNDPSTPLKNWNILVDIVNCFLCSRSLNTANKTIQEALYSQCITVLNWRFLTISLQRKAD